MKIRSNSTTPTTAPELCHESYLWRDPSILYLSCLAHTCEEASPVNRCAVECEGYCTYMTSV